MSRRRRLPFALLAVLMLVGVGIAPFVMWPTPPATAITRENAARIKPGMTRAEVEALLGGPERHEADGILKPDPGQKLAPGVAPERVEDLMHPEVFTDASVCRWKTNNLMIVVYFGDDDRVSGCDCYSAQLVNPTILDRLRRWLRRLGL
jgi:hypothetical protein